MIGDGGQAVGEIDRRQVAALIERVRADLVQTLGQGHGCDLFVSVKKSIAEAGDRHAV